MGIGLDLIGKWRPSGLKERLLGRRERLEPAEDWLRKNLPALLLLSIELSDTTDGGQLITFVPHPAAEPVRLSTSRAGHIRLSAKTSTVGPNYHAFLCEVLRKLGEELTIDWSAPDGDLEAADPTGCFFSGSPADIAPVMLTWLEHVARHVLQLIDSTPGLTQLQLCLEAATEFTHDGVIATPMGPRDRFWLETTSDDARLGTDIFPWWQRSSSSRGQLSLDAAVCMMWSSIRWRAPLTESETRDLRRVAQLLARAREQDPALPCPWREWNEILACLGEACDEPGVGGIADRARQLAEDDAPSPLIGYRRREIARSLFGGWKITIPGSFAEEADETSWRAWDDSGRQVILSVFSAPGLERLSPEELVQHPVIQERRRASATRSADMPARPGEASAKEQISQVGKFARSTAEYGTLFEENGAQTAALTAVSVSPGGVALLIITYGSQSEQWAQTTFRSLDYTPVK